jgi:hypothetical protein
MASVVCAYQIKSVHEVVEHGEGNTQLALCSLHSGEVCWVTYDSLLHWRAELRWSHRAPRQPPTPPLPFGLDRDHAQTVVDIVHPFPTNVDAIFQRVCRIEALIRRTPPDADGREMQGPSTPVATIPSHGPARESCPDARATGGADEDASDFDALLRDVMMGDDLGGFDAGFDATFNTGFD